MRRPALLLRLLGPCLAALLAVGCATPVGVERASSLDTYRRLTTNVLSAGTPSVWSLQVLNRADLADRFEADPEATLEALREPLSQRVTADRLFALAELSFLHAQETKTRGYYLAAVAYAYAFLFPEARPPPDALDPRLRLAADLYNLGLAAGFAAPGGADLAVEPGIVPLPFGDLQLSLPPAELEWSGYRFTHLVPVGDFEIRGLRNHYRVAGLGAPLAAELEPVGSGPAAEAARKRIPPSIKVPVTLFVRFERPVQALVEGRLHARIEIHTPDEAPSVSVDGRIIPLERDYSATLAYMLEGARVWDLEIAGFRFGDARLFGDGLVMLAPHRRGRIPLVLVHGTASSIARWAELLNELAADAVLRERFEVWFFTYNTGQPVLYSAHLLRAALTSAVTDLDPHGEDPALRRMVVVGHSQGGLLAKLMVIHSGTRFWDNVSTRDLAELDLEPETRTLLEAAMFFHPLPTVKRVVFIATPHRGSFRASDPVRNLVRRFVALPGRLADQFRSASAGANLLAFSDSRLPTSVDNMSPGHPFVRTLAASPIDPGVAAHSIIAVRGPGPPWGQTDGVVAYESAHVDGVASELVVRSGHSAQSHPDTIAEMRRILLEHAETR
ncbi:MAG TPA: hypothetical protein VIM86_17145 [Thermodesulfobacteriota bacterium]